MATPIRLDGLLAKVESTYGTDPTPTAADNGVRVSERLWSSMTIEHAFLNRREGLAGFGILPGTPAARTGRMATLEIAWDCRGAGAAYADATPGPAVLPEASPLLRACGFSETVVETGGSESVTYTHTGTGHSSCTIYAYSGNKLFNVNGCRGTLRWPLTAGEFGIMRFTMQGFITSDPTEVALPSITYDSVVSPTAVGASLAVGGWSPDVLSAEFDLAGNVVRVDSANASDAIVSFEISEMNPSVVISAKLPAIATYNPYENMQNATANDIDWTLGSTQYNRVKFDAKSKAYLEAIAHADQESFAGVDLTYQLTDFDIVFD